MQLSKIVLFPLTKIYYMVIGGMRNNDPNKAVKNLLRKGMKVGQNVHVYNSFIDAEYYNLIEIGSNVTITNATILAHDASTQKFLGYTKIGGVKIGDNVFIGYGSIILPGTQIGNDVIIGAGTVVRGEIPNDSVVIGNPGHVVCKTSEYVKSNKEKLTNTSYYDMNKQEDINRMTASLKRGFID